MEIDNQPQEAPQEATQEAPQEAAQAGDPNADTLDRFVTNVMLLASDKQKKQMMGIATGAGNPQEALTKAMYFIIEAVAKGLEGKGVVVPVELYLAPNGIIMESAKIVATILMNNGVDLDEKSVSESMQQVAKLIGERVEKGQPSEGMHQMPDGSMMADADMPQQPQQGGLLSEAGQ